ncbi:hypothetical protein GQ600_12538 [Phytophthora cactorum]|nr:hypothetical protein GQ600_12538 [Phytophthora cactorum]
MPGDRREGREARHWRAGTRLDALPPPYQDEEPSVDDGRPDAGQTELQDAWDQRRGAAADAVQSYGGGAWREAGQAARPGHRSLYGNAGGDAAVRIRWWGLDGL